MHPNSFWPPSTFENMNMNAVYEYCTVAVGILSSDPRTSSACHPGHRSDSPNHPIGVFSPRSVKLKASGLRLGGAILKKWPRLSRSSWFELHLQPHHPTSHHTIAFFCSVCFALEIGETYVALSGEGLKSRLSTLALPSSGGPTRFHVGPFDQRS
jgi:hypothetical protein